MTISKRFLETCELNLLEFPNEPCPLALARLNNKKERYGCDYYINDASCNYCFWVYISKKENQRFHTLEEISNKLNVSINNIKIVENEAFKRIKKTIVSNNNMQLIEDEFGEIRDFLKEE